MKSWLAQLCAALALAGCGAGDGISAKDSVPLNAYLQIWKPIQNDCFSALDGNGQPYFYKEYGLELALQDLTTVYQFFSDASCAVKVGDLALRYDLTWQVSPLGTQPRFVKIDAFNGRVIRSDFLNAPIPDIDFATAYKDILYTLDGLLYAADPTAPYDAQGFPSAIHPVALFFAQ